MDKYTKSLIAFIRIPLGIFYALIGLSLIGVSIWVSTFSDVASMILIMAFLGGGALINFGVGYAFLGDDYKVTNYVSGGNSRFTPEQTPKFLKRRKLVTFIGFVSYVVLAVYYVVRAIFVNVFIESIDFEPNVVALIIYAVISLALAVFLFLLYKKTKHVDLGEN